MKSRFWFTEWMIVGYFYIKWDYKLLFEYDGFRPSGFW
jgi:hypothetical protein